jgi:hypothetical protein
MDNPYPSNLERHLRIMNLCYQFVRGPERQPEHGELDIFRGQEFQVYGKADPTRAITTFGEEKGE